MKKISIPNNIEKKVELKIKIQNNNIFKETYIKTTPFETTPIIKMQTFFKIPEKDVINEIENDNYAIYFLIDNENNKIYIGKSQNFAYRIKRHFKEKQFVKILLFSSAQWTPTIIAYLEYWFINFFINNKTFDTENAKLESKPKYTPFDNEYIEYALEILKWLLLTEGINIDNCTSNKNQLKENLSNGNNLETKNTYVSKSQNNTFEQTYDLLDENMRNLVDTIINRICQIQENVYFEKLLRYGSFKIRKSENVKQNFASLVLQKRAIKLYLHLKSYGDKLNELSFIEDIENKDHWGTGNIEVVITNIEQFNSIFDFVSDAYKENC